MATALPPEVRLEQFPDAVAWSEQRINKLRQKGYNIPQTASAEDAERIAQQLWQQYLTAAAEEAAEREAADAACAEMGGLDEVCVMKDAQQGIESALAAMGVQLRGLVLTHVKPNSPASQCSWQQYIGWRIARVGDKMVSTLEELDECVRGIEDMRIWFSPVVDIMVMKDADQGIDASVQAMGLELSGLLLTGVLAGSPAEECGMGQYIGWHVMRVGDTCIWSYDDFEECTKGATEMHLYFGQVQEVTTLKDVNEGLESALVKMGVVVDGLVMTRVKSGSPADECGWRQYMGWRIVRINNHTVFSYEELVEHAQGAEELKFCLSKANARPPLSEEEEAMLEAASVFWDGVTDSACATRRESVNLYPDQAPAPAPDAPAEQDEPQPQGWSPGRLLTPTHPDAIPSQATPACPDAAAMPPPAVHADPVVASPSAPYESPHRACSPLPDCTPYRTADGSLLIAGVHGYQHYSTTA